MRRESLRPPDTHSNPRYSHGQGKTTGAGQAKGESDMADVHSEDLQAPRVSGLPDITGPTTPRWLVRAFDLFADHNLPNDEFDLRGQYTENRMFLRRIEQDRIDDKLNANDLREMEESFAKACADPEGDPMLAIEKVYLDKYYARQPQRRAKVSNSVVKP